MIESQCCGSACLSTISIFMYLYTASLSAYSCRLSTLTSICFLVSSLLLLLMKSSSRAYFWSLFLPKNMMMCLRMS